MVKLKRSSNYSYYTGMFALVSNTLIFEFLDHYAAFYSTTSLAIATIWYKYKTDAELRESFNREKDLIKMLEKNYDESR